MKEYIGIGSQRGIVRKGRISALRGAFRDNGIRPARNWRGVDPAFCGALLDWHYSGDWIVRDMAAPVCDRCGEPIRTGEEARCVGALVYCCRCEEGGFL